jgi:hypothetical protein
MEGYMAAAQQEQELESDDDVVQDEEQADAQQADGEDSDAAAGESGTEAESAKEEVHPSLTVTSPGSGAQFPKDQPIPVEFDCEGDVEFTAHASVIDANGNQVLEDAADLELDEGKGHGAFALAGDGLVAGKYDVLVWGESNGQATAVQKLQVEIVETEAEEEPAPAVNVEGDDGDSDDLTA